MDAGERPGGAAAARELRSGHRILDKGLASGTQIRVLGQGALIPRPRLGILVSPVSGALRIVRLVYGTAADCRRDRSVSPAPLVLNVFVSREARYRPIIPSPTIIKIKDEGSGVSVSRALLAALTTVSSKLAKRFFAINHVAALDVSLPSAIMLSISSGFAGISRQTPPAQLLYS